jgi:gas vesicle protein
MRSLNAMLGFIAGAAAGAAIGILYAPEKGVTTRKKIKDQAQKTTDDMKEGLSHKIDELNSFVSRFANETQRKIDDLEKKTQREVNETKHVVK